MSRAIDRPRTGWLNPMLPAMPCHYYAEGMAESLCGAFVINPAHRYELSECDPLALENCKTCRTRLLWVRGLINAHWLPTNAILATWAEQNGHAAGEHGQRVVITEALRMKFLRLEVLHNLNAPA